MCYCFNGHRTDFWCFGSAVVSIGYESCNICFCFLHSEQRPLLPLNALDYAVRRHHRLWIRMRPRPVWAPHGCRRRSGGGGRTHGSDGGMHHEWSRDLATAVQVCCLLRVDGGFISRSDGIGGFISKDEKVGFVLNNDRDVAISYSGSALFWSLRE